MLRFLTPFVDVYIGFSIFWNFTNFSISIIFPCKFKFWKFSPSIFEIFFVDFSIFATIFLVLPWGRKFHEMWKKSASVSKNGHLKFYPEVGDFCKKSTIRRIYNILWNKILRDPDQPENGFGKFKKFSKNFLKIFDGNLRWFRLLFDFRFFTLGDFLKQLFSIWHCVRLENFFKLFFNSIWGSLD